MDLVFISLERSKNRQRDGYTFGGLVSAVRFAAMATKEVEASSTVDVGEGKTRDLYNALRTSEHGVSIEALAQALYFLQHAEFTLFDVKDAFRSSTGASESFLAYREFQVALTKIARVKYYGNYENMADPGGSFREAGSPKQRRRLSEVDLVGSLVSQLLANHPYQQLDPLRCQMLYGKQNRLSTNTAPSMQSTMTLDGFVDFLNAYFEYEEFFSYDNLTRMSKEVLSAFAAMNTKAESKCSEGQPGRFDEDFNFVQFLELWSYSSLSKLQVSTTAPAEMR
ncbi:hypothetical protein BBJ29_009043 [Phytophthora kernoviae]|uniref:EF-hand domain-containing protein n=1 Tax=Phytophthora kernoviae TaxID=325452 RepID=A0A421FVN3_9STRA|nr:hypothetical protein BBJ29_009043 [Phytophthora kernoviae]